MQAEDMARLLYARRSGKGRYRAKCPTHKSRGLTLAIYSDPDRVGLHCHAGCKRDDILATLGLTWRDLLYEDKRLTPEEKREWARRKREADQIELAQRNEILKMMEQAINRKYKRVYVMTDFDWTLWLFTGGRNDRREASKFYRDKHEAWLAGDFD